MVKIKIKKNISNKLYYTLLVLSFILILGLSVYAFGTSNPNNFGHSAEEITGGTINGDLTITGKLDIPNNVINSNQINSGGFIKSKCSIDFTNIGGTCISNFYTNNIFSGDEMLAFATSGFGASFVGAHVCRRDEIVKACAPSNPSWAYPPPGYTFLLGDSCGDDCQLYINQPWACTKANLYNIEGPINPHQFQNWAVRICYN